MEKNYKTYYANPQHPFRQQGGAFGEAHIIQNQAVYNLTPINLNREVPIFNESMMIKPSTFEKFIEKLLKKHGLDDKTIKKIVGTPDYMNSLQQSLTDFSIDSVNNLELFETLGDTAFHHSITRFLVGRFPSLKNFADPESVLSNLRTCLEKGSTFAHLFYERGFTPFIKCDPIVLKDFFEKVLEDCLEAFYGCVELIIDSINGDENGKGYAFIEKVTRDFFENKFEDEFKEIDEILKRKELKEVYLRVESRVKILKELMNANERVLEYDRLSSFDKYFEFTEPELLKSEDGAETYYCKCKIKLHITVPNQEPYPAMDWCLGLNRVDAKEKAAENAIKYLASIHIGYPKKIKENDKQRNKRADQHCRPSTHRDSSQ